MKILYIEDHELDRQRLEEAVHQQSIRTGERPMILRSIGHPDELFATLDEHFDLVLADVMFPDSQGKNQDRLSDIIKSVKDWSNKNKLGRSVPIIAYTSAGRDILKSCLARRDDLYDIWDKSTASADYVTWRFEQLSLELSRARPDSLLQRLIRTMPSGSRWHTHVVAMTQEYGKGWTEMDQVNRAGTIIQLIGAELGCLDSTQRWWNLMFKWDPLSRAVSNKSRGHARHVINVFWLGYHILHQPLLKQFWTESFDKLLSERQGMHPVKDSVPLEAFSDTWFYAGLFHDVAGCGEKFFAAYTAMTELASNLHILSPFPTKVPEDHTIKENRLLSRITGEANILSTKLFMQLPEATKRAIEHEWQSGLAKGKPDHGVLAALEIVQSTTEKGQQCYTREAARAMIVHNLVSTIKGQVNIGVTWQDEPIASLLLLCDQLQTWDRERGDDLQIDDPTPTQAELLYLEVVNGDAKPIIKIGIHYVGARILTQSNAMFDRAFQKLEDVLQRFPLSSINKITGEWPFQFEARFWLNGKPLQTTIFKA